MGYGRGGVWPPGDGRGGMKGVTAGEGLKFILYDVF